MQVERLASSSAMRMYTSYNGMRSTGGATAPFGKRVRACGFAGPPSLAMLMQLLVGVVVLIPPPRPPPGEPGVELPRHHAGGAVPGLPRGAPGGRCGLVLG